MMRRSAIVLRVDGDEALVELVEDAGCGGCAAAGGCGIRMLGRIFRRRQGSFRALAAGGRQPGDHVTVGLDEGAVLRTALAAYGGPLAGMLSGAAVAVSLWPSAAEPVAVAGAFAGLGAGLLWLRRFTRRMARDPRYHPIVLPDSGNTDDASVVGIKNGPR